MLLKKALDPNDTDPLVDNITFFNVMKPKKVIGETSLNLGSATQLSPSTICDVKAESSETTIGSFCNVYVDNFSINNESDLMIPQEHVKQLKHQNRKLTDELENTRSQLTAAEE
ncbi:hypothetical protein ILUMI_21337 [Ignelater luminosus]|uniref:Uncharacterized protein n=1 Tax=Ignelater luminosus TaxID=2038154 RepID=A0A8K0CJ47_IGNLU|nr:hypothetical protein ILUMI_21337 [Ignelater luminosus]